METIMYARALLGLPLKRFSVVEKRKGNTVGLHKRNKLNA
jgi:hypothetical protein